MIAKHQEKQTVVKLKKLYSVFSQTHLNAINENGSPDKWDLTEYDSPVGSVNLLNKWQPYLKITRNCGNDEGCWFKTKYKLLNGNDAVKIPQTAAKAILSDGTSIAIDIRSSDCTQVRGYTKSLSSTCATAMADTNGLKGPNQVGRDIFTFVITKYDIIPPGTIDNLFQNFETNCRKDNEGFGCTAWVIFNENMDYLHCDDLFWEGKTKCD